MAAGPLVDRTVDVIAQTLGGYGRAALVTTTGRRSGSPRTVALGFIDEPDGSIVVAANSERADWARNLEADPACSVQIAERRFAAIAEPLDRDEHVSAVRALILRYGTPSEGLGRGPSFRLRPDSGPAT